MGSNEPEGVESTKSSPPPPIPADVVPLRMDSGGRETLKKVSKPKRVPMARNGMGTNDNRKCCQSITLKVVSNVEGYIYHYCVFAHSNQIIFPLLKLKNK
ncbi:hypothetical protein MKW94_008860 [Papaver nudicaule]|uniref:Uncharacterized protein n=1 Tax=Papaver nudicaule TaxID=74823 RepID=A0AA41RS62_PAPNU|nr:hypothetical protein [Papaver nudicaule]